MNVYFTVDTEASMGGAWQNPERRPVSADRHVFCQIGGQDFGIGRIADILRQSGFRATYFVETLATLVNGDADTSAIFDYLLRRGEDVQLHIHPTYRFYAEAVAARQMGRIYQAPPNNDMLGGFSEDRQMELLEQAAGLFRHHAGRAPEAFRAGSFSADRRTLRCLKKLGISLDTSFNPCCDWSFPSEALEPNRPRQLEGVWELPVTVARTPLREGYRGFKLADPVALSVAELRTMLEAGVAGNQRHFVIVLHSFSLVKAKDETYDAIRPDRIVIRRLEKLVQYLASRPDLYRVATIAEVASETVLEQGDQAPVAKLGLVDAGVRKSVQGFNRCYWI